VLLSSNTSPTDLNNYLNKVIYLKRFNNSSKKFQENRSSYNQKIKSPCNQISPNHILVDFIYDICRNNAHLKKYGFFQNIGVNDSIYKYKNKYTIFHNEIGKDYGAVKEEVEALINVIFGSFTAIKEIYKSGNYILNNENISKAKKEGGTIDFDAISNLIIKMKMDSLNSDIKEDWNALLNGIVIITQNENSNENDLLYFIREKVKPALIKINIASKSDIKYLIDSLTKYENFINNKVIDSLRSDYKKLVSILNKSQVGNNANTNSSCINVSANKTQGIDLRNFIQLVNTINSLEDPSTYDIIAKFITNLGGIYGDNSAITVLNQFVNDFDKYLLVDNEKDQLEINVEDIAVDLFERFGENQSSRFSAYLSVGINNSKVINAADGEPSSLNFVSEKIGFKFKIVDWNKRISYGINDHNKDNKRIKQYHRNASKTKPILGDMHIFIYASGLLYQVDFLNSESSKFSEPIIGAGVGFSFFNGLDLNFSYALPTSNDFSFWNIGFDIKITEYLAELGKKKRRSKNE